MKIFYRVKIKLEDDIFSFDFYDEIEAIKFAKQAFCSEMSYDRTWVEVIEYDPEDMTTIDSPCRRKIND